MVSVSQLHRTTVNIVW